MWVEVAAEGVQAAIFADSGGAVVGRGTEPGRRLTWYRLGHAAGAPPPPGAEPDSKANGQAPAARMALVQQPALRYAEGDEAVVIDMATPSAPEAPAAGPPGSDADDESGEEDDVEPTMILQRPSDGSRPKAWKRQQLGWYGAVKAIVGYNKPRRDVPLGIGSLERRKTSTY